MTLETLLGSKLRAKVLGWLFSHPDERYFVRQLTRLLEEDSTNVSRELARLEKTGILVTTKDGNQKYYRANRKSPLFEELHGLAVKTAGVADTLRSALTPEQDRIRSAFIFGSFARGEENRASDIDLMVIGNLSFADISSLLNKAQEQLGREINPVVYPVAEFRTKVTENHHFLRTVIEGEKLFIIGDENELGRLIE
ncbi:MAG: nucleotidyltransferase domain-containing protein [Dehalococcoidales bacterium]|nr:nucleotidyltransferase domain-containing protein [Dehalococcoidales bacterium]